MNEISLVEFTNFIEVNFLIQDMIYFNLTLRVFSNVVALTFLIDMFKS